MESYRRDTTDEPLRDPETGQVLDPAGTADDRTDPNDLDDRNDLRDRNDLTGPNDLPDRNDLPGLGEDESDGPRVKQDEQADLIVYPDEADYPTRSDEDDSLTAGVPDLEPEPVLAASEGVNDNDVHGTAGAGTGSIDFQQRWREVQAGFVDDPRDAVERADQLVEEAVTALTSRRQGLVDRWKNSDQGDTEQLRLALRDYRSLLEELVGPSYSTAGHGSSPASREAR
ncbi:hypothetical protein OG589_20310 [Sphaerisporangium sp. NBC_01403]|uniref:hypothetical protein n=1 Tax=Sphaerisporangium sp. NBC_01403 TaxID=2903599 RepID=UPI00324E8502